MEGLILINILKINIWDREFELEVEYDCFSNEEVTDDQKKTIDRFAKHPDWIEKSKDLVKDYCRKSLMEDEDNKKKDNIFSYIKPEYLYVLRDKANPKVALMCNYRYEPEHGLAIVYSFDGKAVVGTQDII